jgi:hypothetical protein
VRRSAVIRALMTGLGDWGPRRSCAKGMSCIRVPRQSTAVEHDTMSLTVTPAHTHRHIQGDPVVERRWAQPHVCERVVSRLPQPSKDMMAPYRGRCVRRVCVCAVWGGGARGS